jgi:hypothetical protein
MPAVAVDHLVELALAVDRRHARSAGLGARPPPGRRLPPEALRKSRLLDVVAETCHAPLITINATIAAVVRSIGQDPPTLLVDEADTLAVAGNLPRDAEGWTGTEAG